MQHTMTADDRETPSPSFERLLGRGYSATNTEAGTFPVPLRQIRPSTINPRKRFDEAGLVELAESIARHGLLEPLVVREATATARGDTPEGGSRPGEIVLYEIVAGERRYRAMWLVALARAAGEPVAEVATWSREAREALRDRAGEEFVEARYLGALPDAEALELALVENLQRQDLDPIEEAEGYRELNRVVGLTQAEIGRAVNRSQPAVANALRLLALPEGVRERIRAGELSVSHGVALAKWKQYPEFVGRLAERAAAEGYTAKQLEQTGPGDWLARGAYEELHGGVGFDIAACRDCPFDAYRETGEGYRRGYCLQPSHFAARQAEAEAARGAAAVAKAAAKVGPEEAAGLPRLAGMAHGSYRDLTTFTTPAGCSAACACRGRAIDHDGRVVPICTDPKRFAHLQDAVARAEARAKRERKAARLAEALAAVDGLVSGEAAKRELVLLTEHLVVGAAGGRIAVLRAALQRQAPALDADTLTGYQQGREGKRLRALARLSERQLLRLAVELILRRDIEDQFGAYTSGGQVADWYLRASAADAAAGEATAADD